MNNNHDSNYKFFLQCLSFYNNVPYTVMYHFLQTAAVGGRQLLKPHTENTQGFGSVKLVCRSNN